MKYQRVCVAGTFDGLHKGHEAVLQAAFRAGEKVVIALTSDQYVKQFKTSNSKFQIKPYAKRKKILESWLKQRDYFKRAEFIPLDDPVGPGDRADFEALIVTSQNRATGEKINALRRAWGKPPVILIEVPLVWAADQAPISSTRLRAGEIDRNGGLVMPDRLRPELQQPLGKVLAGPDIRSSLLSHAPPKVVIGVGDFTVKTILQNAITPAVAIIDHQVNRKPYAEIDRLIRQLPKTTKVYRLRSGPGYISREAIKAIQAALASPTKPDRQKTQLIEVTGEEDLLTLPAIAYAPLGSIIYYGQPAVAAWACGPLIEGLVEVVVTSQVQKNAKRLLSKFSLAG